MTKLDSSTTPTTMRLQVFDASVPPGTYSGTVFVESTSAANSPLAIPLSLTVTP